MAVAAGPLDPAVSGDVTYGAHPGEVHVLELHRASTKRRSAVAVGRPMIRPRHGLAKVRDTSRERRLTVAIARV
jgi:hypothetical protein